VNKAYQVCGHPLFAHLKQSDNPKAYQELMDTHNLSNTDKTNFLERMETYGHPLFSSLKTDAL